MPTQRSGFTLIELLVSIGIMVMLMSGGALVFTSFNQRQQTQVAVEDLNTFFKKAHTYARVKTVPPSCEVLEGYQVVSSGGSIVMQSVCSTKADPAILITNTVDTYVKPSNISSIQANSLSTNTTTYGVRFLTLQSGAQMSLNNGAYSDISTMTPIRIIVTGPGNVQYQFWIYTGGVIASPVRM